MSIEVGVRLLLDNSEYIRSVNTRLMLLGGRVESSKKSSITLVVWIASCCDADEPFPVEAATVPPSD